MRPTQRLLPALLLCLVPAASQAVNVPLPIKDATLNLQIHIQPRFQLTENGTPNGQDTAYDFFVRRTRLQANGAIGDNWLYLLQVDNALDMACNRYCPIHATLSQGVEIKHHRKNA